MASRSAVSVEVAVRADAEIGEGPVWDVATSTLLWVDIAHGALYRTTLDGTTTTEAQLPFTLGAVAPAGEEAVVVACERGIGLLAGTDLDLRVPIEVAGERMNDAKCDPAGRFWAGSNADDLTPGRGTLHVVTPDWEHRAVASGFTLTNGLDWSLDARTFYLADSEAHCVYAYDFDVEDGALGERREFFRVDADGEVPDGLTVDADGCVWLAVWGGGRVLRISPDGDVLTTVEIPVPQPSSCAFGGKDLTDLYVTSARENLHVAPDALDGSLFVVRGLGVTGRAPNSFGKADA